LDEPAKRSEVRATHYIVASTYIIMYVVTMKFEALLELVGSRPAFESAYLLAGSVDAGYLRRQLSGWVSEGRLIRLRRGLYVLAAPYRGVEPHPFLLANMIRRGSYVSLQSVLEQAGLILEQVPTVTSVWAGRPGEVQTPLGRFLYRHVNPALLYAYYPQDLGERQDALVAEPEKALLDLVHLTGGGDCPAFLKELRLEDIRSLSEQRLREYADRSGSPKLQRAAMILSGWIREGGVPA